MRSEGLPMARVYNVVDADGHLLEPLDLWDNTNDAVAEAAVGPRG